MAIPEGYELLEGRSSKNARAALQSAEERGLSPLSVLTVREGYLIPIDENAGGRAAAPASIEDLPPKAPAGADGADGGEVDDSPLSKLPDSADDWKVADFDAFAQEHGVTWDNGVTTKAEKLEALKAALAKKED